MGARKKTWTDEAVVDRAAFVERTVKDLCELLRAGAPYPEISARIERAGGACRAASMSSGGGSWCGPLAPSGGARPDPLPRSGNQPHPVPFHPMLPLTAV